MTDSKNVTVKVSDTPTPSQEIVAKAKQSVEVIDSIGRKIVLERPSILKSSQIAAFLGEKSSNLGYLAIVTPFYFVTSINSIPVTITTQLELDALMEELGYPGRDAVIEGIEKHFADEINTAKEGEVDLNFLDDVKK